MIYITMIILLNQSGNELALTSSPARKTKKQTARFIWTTEEKQQTKKRKTNYSMNFLGLTTAESRHKQSG